MTTENNEPQFELMPPTALESITRGEIDLQISTAHRFPRSMAQFKKRALDMALIDEETAESCIYCRPVGMKDGKQQYAEGMSIRMAEIVGASYGNIRVGSMIIEQTERMVKCRGMAHDLESNFASASECIETTVTKRGEPFSESMRAVVAKACLAKAWRDALFKVVPKALCKPIETEIRKLMVGDAKSLEARRALVMQWVSKLGIDVARVFAAIGVQGEEDIGTDQLMLLTGLKNALKEGDATIEDAFPPLGANSGDAPKFVPKPKAPPAAAPEVKPQPEAQKQAEPTPPAAATPPAEPAPTPKAPRAKKPEPTPAATPIPDDKLTIVNDGPVELPAPASAPAATEGDKAAEKQPEAPQAAASAHPWREYVIDVRNPAINGKKLGDLSVEEMLQIRDGYLKTVSKEPARMSLSQKGLAARLSLALAELMPETPAELPRAANAEEGVEPAHTKELKRLIDAYKLNRNSFMTVCHRNGYIADDATKIEDISEQDATVLLEGWETIVKETLADQP